MLLQGLKKPPAKYGNFNFFLFHYNNPSLLLLWV